MKLCDFPKCRNFIDSGEFCNECKDTKISYEKRNATVRKYNKSPEVYFKAKVRALLNYHVGTGKIKRQPCEQCGEVAEAHHDDYTKPLEVRWLCNYHHTQHHLNLKYAR